MRNNRKVYAERFGCRNERIENACNRVKRLVNKHYYEKKFDIETLEKIILGVCSEMSYDETISVMEKFFC